ncbi:MAG: phosphatidylserine decarboxylase family protein [Bacteroidetes bacterium]|nr:MAG: phosphatidylserine decarboxylase family protein [Bacteroidota bacterium]TAG89318.1 MAG: phosphatidylserine decarboxylase family protein [Bacteroidota bacterium]
MSIHKEGYISIFIAFMIGLAPALLGDYLQAPIWFNAVLFVLGCILIGLVLNFFRNPYREIQLDRNIVYAPCDGKIVVIEEVIEDEYFKGKRKQISIFMSPLNVHVNRNPVAGIVRYFKYHAGKYLVAWHPKSSTENERTTYVIQALNGQDILLRQIAGAVARRICWYVNVGESVQQGEEFGFIKFGSRVDIFLPLDTKINVEIGQKAVGGKTILATFS